MKKLLRQAAQYSVILLYSLLIFSCSKNITQQSVSRNASPQKFVREDSLATVITTQAIVLPGNPVRIDSQRYTASSKTNVVAKDSYFNQKVKQKVEQFYKQRGAHTMWLNENAPNNLYYALLFAIKAAPLYGLSAEDYDVSRIEKEVSLIYQDSTLSPTARADADVHITEMYFLFTTHMLEGKVRTTGYADYIWIRQPKPSSMTDVSLLAETSRPEQIAESITRFQPINAQYVKLQRALEQYRAFERSSPRALPLVSINTALKQGDRHIAVPVIRRKLSLATLKVYPMALDSVTGMVDSLYYDQNLTDAIRFFQAKHGLEPDGIIGDKTVRFLNQSFAEKADIIALNMERLRWVPSQNEANYISVNVPEYKLRVFENQKQTLEMKVIVGAPNKPTPIFSDALDHIVFSPTWTVPVSIIKEEIIPRLKKNPSYYAQKNYSFYKNETAIDPVNESWSDEAINPYQYRVVQGPGPDNSLGLVKFIMPNNMSVYLHDTPNHRLFSKDYRALSHGCIRLDEPGKFAAYLLRDQNGWNTERIRKAMNDTAPATIHLKKYYAVHIEYYTAWVDDEGEVNFREDIYGHDKMQLQQLNQVVRSSSGFAGI